jgi:hypothetical protein
MSSVLAPTTTGNGLHLVRLTVEQFQEVLGRGIFREGMPIELLDGLMVWKDQSDRGGDPRRQGPRHADGVYGMSRALLAVESLGHLLRVQLPVTLGIDHAPEPDLAVIRGIREQFRQRHPGTDDIRLLVEVADSSLDYDRTTKLAIYAEAGIPEYWIVNLVDSQIHVYGQPIRSGRTYANERIYSLADTIAFAPDPTRTIDVPVGEVIPA